MKSGKMMQIENASPVLYKGLPCDAEKSVNSAVKCIILFEKNIALALFNHCTQKDRMVRLRNEIVC